MHRVAHARLRAPDFLIVPTIIIIRLWPDTSRQITFIHRWRAVPSQSSNPDTQCPTGAHSLVLKGDGRRVTSKQP